MTDQVRVKCPRCGWALTVTAETLDDLDDAVCPVCEQAELVVAPRACGAEHPVALGHLCEKPAGHTEGCW